jgi:ParB-like chromosome segregation protein Spo0J
VVRRSALEESWLLEALIERHGLSQHELARRLGHTTSWVSRRLGLLTALPEAVQEQVRTGALAAYSATKYLVPLARANASDCEKLAAALAGHPLTTRQMERLYVAWRSSDAQGRTRLVERPLLFLQADREMAQAEPPHPDAALVKDVEVLGAICHRVQRRLTRRSKSLALPEELTRLWPGTQQSMDALRGLMEEKVR